MQRTSHQSIWIDTTDGPSFPVASSRDVDVAIVGAGIAGLVTALLLTEDGRSVAVIDRGPIARGQTALTTAHLTWMLDIPLSQLRRKHRDHASHVLEAHASAIQEIERITRRHSIECGFQRVSAWRFGLRAGQRRMLEREARIARELGRDAHYVGPGTLRLPSPGGAVHAPDQAKFHPLAFALAVAQRIATSGSHVFAHSPVTETERVGERWVVSIPSRDAVIRARDLVIATNSPIGLVPTLQTRLEPFQSYALAARIAHGTIPVGLYWDSEDPYQYIRVDSDGSHDTLILGGMDHKTGAVRDTREAHAALVRYLRETLGIVPDALTHRWSGEVLEPVDGVAYIGKFPASEPHRWVATGFSGNGMTYGVISGLLLRDLVLGRENAWTDAFDPARARPIASAWNFLRANVEVATHFVTDHLASAECSRIADVPRGEGRIVERSGRKLAVFRNERDEVTTLSPVCPHMGCNVQWNALEKTWDCPCHGSRFGTDGSVECGPAMRGLEPVEPETGSIAPEPATR